MKLWIARDKGGFLCLYKEKPTWTKIDNSTWDWNGEFMGFLPKNEFLELTFENSPRQVEIKLI